MIASPGEIPTASPELGPEVRLFNVDALSDDEIVVLFRGISAAANEGYDEAELPFDQMHTGDGLLDRLARDMRDLASRDPERVKGLVDRCARSGVVADEDLAASTVSALLPYNYEFTRDTLAFLHANAADGTVGESVFLEIHRLIDNELTPEQVADFDAHVDW